MDVKKAYYSQNLAFSLSIVALSSVVLCIKMSLPFFVQKLALVFPMSK